MRLNPDCIRDIILYIEETSTTVSVIRNKQLEDQFSNYSKEELKYHAYYLEESYYLKEISKFMDGGYIIRDVTPLGHKLAQDIRDTNVWSETKGVISKFASVSVDIISNVAAQVIVNIINKQMGL